MLLVLVPLLCLTLPYLTSTCFALISCLAWFSPAVSVCLSVLLHRGPLPLTVHTAYASLFNSCQRLCLFPSLFAWTGPFTSWFQISVDHTYLASSVTPRLSTSTHSLAYIDPEPKQPKPDQTEPNQSAAQRNSIPIRYLDLPKAASTAILPCLQPPQSAIKQYSPNIFAFPRLIILILTYSPRHLFGFDFLRSATPPLSYRSRAHPPANRALPLDRLHFTLT